jgi:endonuclease/exonuclease/phosphatase family metal-dependent hydrolase
VPDTLRVLTFNIAKGLHRQGILEVLQSHPADVICVQEVIIDSSAGPPYHHGQWLAEQLGYQCVCAIRRRVPLGLIGPGLLTNRPIRAEHAVRHHKQRAVAVGAEIETEAGPCVVCSMHLRGVPPPRPLGFLGTIRARVGEVGAILAWLEGLGMPAVVAGDTNTLGFAPEYRRLAAGLRDCSRAVGQHHPTRPTWGLPCQLDRVFVTEHFRIDDCEMIPTDVSDHHALLATVTLGGVRA